mgnify:CR=1 FL=1
MAGNQTYMSVEVLRGVASQPFFFTDARQDINIILPPPYQRETIVNKEWKQGHCMARYAMWCPYFVTYNHN